MHKLRLATPDDAPTVSVLVLGLARDLLVDPAGEDAKRFYAAMAPGELARYMAMQNRFYVVAEANDQLLGMVMVLNGNYIGQFFVDRAHQGKGTGSALWQFALGQAKRLGATGEFTVDSSLAAVPIYRRFGFETTGGVSVENGFKFIPMHRAADHAT